MPATPVRFDESLDLLVLPIRSVEVNGQLPPPKGGGLCLPPDAPVATPSAGGRIPPEGGSLHGQISMNLTSVLSTVLLLIVSNAFMTVAWYGHLRHKSSPLWWAILSSWGWAFFEYVFQVPANRLGSNSLSVTQLKIVQECITLVVFSALARLSSAKRCVGTPFWPICSSSWRSSLPSGINYEVASSSARQVLSACQGARGDHGRGGSENASMIGKILIVDDEKNLRESLAEAVEAEGFHAEQAADGAEALRKIGEEEFACILLDLRMPRVDGLRVLAMIREGELTDAPVIVISAFGESERTIEAMRLGAFDFLVKPPDIEEITRVLRRAVRQSEANRQRRRREKSSATADDRAPRLIGTSQRMREVFKQIGRVAATDATVLITGESGTGKEMIARAIHAHSARADQPFVAVNCGALPETLIEAELFGHERGAFTGAVTTRRGRFEAAQGGTLFLDEIGEMPPSAQVRLLRVFQERKIERIGSTTPIAVGVRVIAATHCNLRAETEAGRFREDLFYRLNVLDTNN